MPPWSQVLLIASGQIISLKAIVLFSTIECHKTQVLYHSKPKASHTHLKSFQMQECRSHLPAALTRVLDFISSELHQSGPLVNEFFSSCLMQLVKTQQTETLALVRYIQSFMMMMQNRKCLYLKEWNIIICITYSRTYFQILARARSSDHQSPVGTLGFSSSR